MTKIEEVARAIYEATWGPNAWLAADGAEMDEAKAQARAAIEAMREPTPGMVDSGVAFALNVTVSGEGGWTKYITAKHRAMIDAALAEPPK